ncbi:hypothetical protein [Mycolicibacterium sediminis]|uniref:Uncharacterized protein n=1 Tax=Mycolicibacterium sediminis TaxID=1286180 RepID=A0A7I7QVI4_9MYCO|nr:hypothetical protein [Mycolicibacterium sediminis]BBY30379.1 hypothetical protein MSEDJ_44750 [Mycolicibacterium sediminis]
MESTPMKKSMGLTGATAVVAAAVAVTFSGASQAEPEPAPPGPVTTPEMTTAEPSVDGGATEGPDTPIVATPPVTATTETPD